MNLAHRLASTFAERLFLDRKAAFWLGELRATWSLREVRARVVEVVDETRDTRTFVLRPNGGWRGHRAGQHTTVEVEIDGVRVRRLYSLSSAPGDRLPAITVKRAGRMSTWLHDRVRPGHLVRLGPAAGDFVLPDPAPGRLLFLSGGSGITPVMSMLRDLAARDAIGDLVFVHHARSHDDVIFSRALAALAARHRGLRLIVRFGRFDESQLGALVPDFAERETFLCGPPGLMARAEWAWERAGASSRLHVERFGAGAAPAAAAGAMVTLARSGRSFPATASGSLLEQLERAGERPAYGCRIGICHTCRCRKRAGTVKNVLTGALSSATDEDIQLCISVPCSDVELGL
ncbi:MAG TPA: 2Fe-2S iron-sulfur cluster-binding protein [Haliangiales bacterium]|nr:2Fe-2S iron-sulfur cluster-binding protein [Haliangiales bacterium]